MINSSLTGFRSDVDKTCQFVILMILNDPFFYVDHFVNSIHRFAVKSFQNDFGLFVLKEARKWQATQCESAGGEIIAE